MATTYTTAEKVKAEVETELSDEAVEALILEVEALIDRLVGYGFYEPSEAVEYHDGDRSGVYPLYQYPVYSLTTVTVGRSTPVEVVTGGCYLDQNVVYFDREVANVTDAVGRHNVAITYDYGYATVPVLIQRAARLLAIDFILKRQQIDHEKQVDAGLAITDWQGFIKFALTDGELTGNIAVDEILREFRAKRPKFIGSV